MTKQVVETELQENVGIIRLCDDRKRNALSNAMRTQLSAAFYAFETNPDVRAVLLTSRGPAFCGGGDFRMMLDESDPWSSHQRFNRTSRWLTDLIEYPKPVVVGVNGPAIGGGIGIALLGDTVIASTEATFVAGFLRLGLIPDIATMYTLPRLVGLAKARAFVYGNQTWTAEQAAAAGLISEVVLPDELESRCLEHAQNMAQMPIEGFSLAKRLMGRSFESSLDQVMLNENLGQSLAYATEAMREGLSAIRESRSADFVAASEREPATKKARNQLDEQ